MRYTIQNGIERTKTKLQKHLIGIFGLMFPVAAALTSGGVHAATTYSLFGDAQLVSPGSSSNTAAQIRSDAAVPPSFGGTSIALSSPVAWADFDTLSTDYNITDDDCGGGSPRLQIRVDTTGDGVSDGSVRVAIGPSPSFTDCPTGWQNTGNVIGNEDAGRYDYSVFGGSPFTTYSNAPAAVTSGQVVGVTVVVDGSWNANATNGDGEQTVLIDNVNVNGDVTTFEPAPTKDSCKNGGWMALTDSNNRPFKNQGDCVSFFATKGKNKANG
jgi:hypothetical protein